MSLHPPISCILLIRIFSLIPVSSLTIKVGEDYIIMCCAVSQIKYSRLHYKDTVSVMTDSEVLDMDNATTTLNFNGTDDVPMAATVLKLTPENGFVQYEWYVVCALNDNDYESTEVCVLVRPCLCPCASGPMRTVNVDAALNNDTRKIAIKFTSNSFGPPYPSSERLEYKIFDLVKCQMVDYVDDCLAATVRNTVSNWLNNKTLVVNVDPLPVSVYEMSIKIALLNKSFGLGGRSPQFPYMDSYVQLGPFVFNFTETDNTASYSETFTHPNSSTHLGDYIEQLNSFSLCTSVNGGSSAQIANSIFALIINLGCFVYLCSLR